MQFPQQVVSQLIVSYSNGSTAVQVGTGAEIKFFDTAGVVVADLLATGNTSNPFTATFGYGNQPQVLITAQSTFAAVEFPTHDVKEQQSGAIFGGVTGPNPGDTLFTEVSSAVISSDATAALMEFVLYSRNRALNTNPQAVMAYTANGVSVNLMYWTAVYTQVQRPVIFDNGHTIPTLNTGFTQDATYPVEYIMESTGFVSMRGRCTTPANSTNGQVIFTLPAAYRSSYDHQWVISMPGSNNFQKITVLHTGEVELGVGAVASMTLDLSSVRFSTMPIGGIPGA